jgi:hypothetical protein
VWNRRDPKVPADAVYVGRPTKWGNPFKIGDCTNIVSNGRPMSRTDVVLAYRDAVCRGREQEIRKELRGKHLVCWCAPLSCHADVLLEIANAKDPTT